MATTDNHALLLQISADVRGLEKAIAKANGIVEDGARSWERSSLKGARAVETALGGIKVPRNLAREYEALGADIGRGLQTGSRVAQIALAGVSAYSIKLAADAEKIESGFDVAFKGSSKSARDFSNVLTNELGRDAVETREAMSRLQLVLTGTGVAAEQAAEMTKKLAEVGIDAGSLFKTSDAEAFQKIISGISGDTGGLKEFGVIINDAAVKAELLRLGFKGTASSASESAKAIARTNLIIKGLAVAQGDAARTSESAANKAKAMKAEFNAAARDLGTQLLPVFVKVAGAATDVLKAFNAMPGGMQIAGLAFLALMAAGGPIATLIGGLLRVIQLAKATRAAIIAAAAVEGVAGAAGAAGGVGAAIGGVGLAVGAGAAVGVTAAVAGGAVLVGESRIQAARKRALADLSKATAQDLEAAVKASAPARGQAGFNAATDNIRAEIARRATVAAGGAPDGKPSADSFNLSGGQLKGIGGAKKGKAAPRDLGDEQAAQLAGQYAAASADLLRSTLDLTADIETRADLEKQVIDQQSKQDTERLNVQRANIADSKSLSPEKKKELLAQIDIVQGLNDQVDLNRKALIDQQAADQLVGQLLAVKMSALDSEEGTLELQQRLAVSVADQRRISLALVDLSYRRAKAELESALAMEGISQADKDILRARLKQLEDAQPGRVGAATVDSFNASAGGQAGLAAFRDPTEDSPLSSKYLDDAKAAIDKSVEVRQALANDEAEKTRIAQEGADARARIDEYAYESRLGFAADFFGNLASLSGSSNKTLAAIGKAAAITQATIDGVLAVQKALATYPPPFNYIAAAGVGVLAAVNVAKIAGLKDGGAVVGPGGPRDDKVLLWGSNGEHMMNAEAVSRYGRGTLDAMNAGTFRMPTPTPFVGGRNQTNNTTNSFAPTLNIAVNGGGSPIDARRTAAQLHAETMRLFETTGQRGFAHG